MSEDALHFGLADKLAGRGVVYPLEDYPLLDQLVPDGERNALVRECAPKNVLLDADSAVLECGYEHTRALALARVIGCGILDALLALVGKGVGFLRLGVLVGFQHQPDAVAVEGEVLPRDLILVEEIADNRNGVVDVESALGIHVDDVPPVHRPKHKPVPVVREGKVASRHADAVRLGGVREKAVHVVHRNEGRRVIHIPPDAPDVVHHGLRPARGNAVHILGVRNLENLVFGEVSVDEGNGGDVLRVVLVGVVGKGCYLAPGIGILIDLLRGVAPSDFHHVLPVAAEVTDFSRSGRNRLVRVGIYPPVEKPPQLVRPPDGVAGADELRWHTRSASVGADEVEDDAHVVLRELCQLLDYDVGHFRATESVFDGLEVGKVFHLHRGSRAVVELGFKGGVGEIGESSKYLLTGLVDAALHICLEAAEPVHIDVRVERVVECANQGNGRIVGYNKVFGHIQGVRAVNRDATTVLLPDIPVRNNAAANLRNSSIKLAASFLLSCQSEKFFRVANLYMKLKCVLALHEYAISLITSLALDNLDVCPERFENKSEIIGESLARSIEANVPASIRDVSVRIHQPLRERPAILDLPVLITSWDKFVLAFTPKQPKSLKRVFYLCARDSVLHRIAPCVFSGVRHIKTRFNELLHDLTIRRGQFNLRFFATRQITIANKRPYDIRVKRSAFLHGVAGFSELDRLGERD